MACGISQATSPKANAAVTATKAAVSSAPVRPGPKAGPRRSSDHRKPGVIASRTSPATDDPISTVHIMLGVRAKASSSGRPR